MGVSVLNSLLPVALMIALGQALRRAGFLDAAFFSGLNRLVFWVGLPCMLFHDIAHAQAAGGEVLRVSGVLILVSAVLLVLGLALGLALRLPWASAGVLAQAIFRGNLAYVGLPVVVFALNDTPEIRALATVAMAPTIPFFNVASVLVLQRRGQGGGLGRNLGRALFEIARNPLIIACLLGLLALHTGIAPGGGIGRTIEGIGRLGLPGALLALGASLSPDRLRGKLPGATLAAVFKVGVAPLLGAWLGPLLGLHGAPLLVALVYLATPTAVASFVMADQMGADRELAGAAIVASTFAALPALVLVLLFGPR